MLLLFAGKCYRLEVKAVAIGGPMVVQVVHSQIYEIRGVEAITHNPSSNGPIRHVGRGICLSRTQFLDIFVDEGDGSLRRVIVAIVDILCEQGK